MNEGNLIPINTRTDFRELSSKGGKASGLKRKEMARNRANMEKALRLMFYYDKDIDTLLYWESMGIVEKLRQYSALAWGLGYSSISEMLDDQIEQAQKKYEAMKGHRMKFKPRLEKVGPWPTSLMDIMDEDTEYNPNARLFT